MKENQRVEWKESWRDEFCKSICAFANAEGGVLVVGRNDDAPQTTPQTTPETTPEKILLVLAARPATTRQQLADELGLTLEGIKYHARKLTAAGRIRHVGPSKAGRWEVLK